MVLACNLVPFFAVILTVNEPAGLDSPALAARMRLTLTIMSFLFMVVGLYLVFLVSANFTRPLKEIVRALDRVRRGNLDTRVKVVTNDELGYTGDMINAMNEGLRERDLVKETFGKYVSAEVRDEILSGRLALEGEVKEATVLFADLRDFTQMVEKTPPREVVRILNRYFEKMEAAVQANDGLVLQYIGDEIEAVFGAPLHRDGHPAMAVQAALQMRGHLDELNRDLLSEGHMPLSHGIGIHTGSILAASIGSPNRLSYAMIGDTVNLAARLQGLNKITGTEILVSAATYERIGKDCGFRALPPVSIKGKTEEIAVYGIASEQAFV
jgi:adenylate cyclase